MEPQAVIAFTVCAIALLFAGAHIYRAGMNKAAPIPPIKLPRFTSDKPKPPPEPLPPKEPCRVCAATNQQSKWVPLDNFKGVWFCDRCGNISDPDHQARV